MDSTHIREMILKELPGLFDTDDEIRHLVLSLQERPAQAGHETAKATAMHMAMQGESEKDHPSKKKTKEATHASGTLYLYCDGASRGNPGPAAIGAVLHRGNEADPESTISRSIGKCTNNEAEYTALIEGIKAARQILSDSHPGRLTIRMDSELVVRQILGLYKVKNDRLRGLYKTAMELLQEIPHWKIEHVPREKNSMADALANQAYGA